MCWPSVCKALLGHTTGSETNKLRDKDIQKVVDTCVRRNGWEALSFVQALMLVHSSVVGPGAWQPFFNYSQGSSDSVCD